MANPYIGGLPWAGGTFPAGTNPWNSQPQDVSPVNNYFTPNVPIAAEDLNYILNQRDKALQYVDAAIGPYAVLEDLVVPIGAVIAGAGGTFSASITAHAWTGSAFAAGNNVALASSSVATLVNDVMEISLSGTSAMNMSAPSTSPTQLVLALTANPNAAGLVNAATSTVIEPSTSSNGLYLRPFAIFTRYSITANPGTFSLGVNGCAFTGGSFTSVGLYGDATARIRHLRPY